MISVNPISYHPNFKGIYQEVVKKDGTVELEYKPYSWENRNQSQPATRKFFSINDSDLPDNEIVIKQSENGEELTTDIFARTLEKNINGQTTSDSPKITQAPAMNLEDSLREKNKKLNLFVNMKTQQMLEIENSSNEYYTKANEISQKFKEHNTDMQKHWFRRKYSNKINASILQDNFSNLLSLLKDCAFNFGEYIEIRKSNIDTACLIKGNEATINKLANARKAGTLVDISRQDVKDPFKPLYDVFAKKSYKQIKYVALPDRIIKMKDLLYTIGKVSEKELPMAAEKYIRNLITPKAMRRFYNI